MKKVRVVVVSGSLRASEAEKFRKHFADSFDGKYLFTGEYQETGQGIKYPLFEIARLAEKDEPEIAGFDRWVNVDNLIDKIPTYSVKSNNRRKVATF